MLLGLATYWVTTLGNLLQSGLNVGVCVEADCRISARQHGASHIYRLFFELYAVTLKLVVITH